ncbi:WUSCHEL-related homeobox 11 [Hibiscus syriacus]|uniref:WUSCHEL-related homeobox 11 n=1 Tax=Hibiscus syriacus TaxID=106335 RepID=A0A6A2YI46_HIBSY|nr:WUSCHEL-related homeobox 11 [Hibiscus syriacus]
MEDQATDPNSPRHGSERNEPDETVRIRKLLEKFGVVGDANVFYWFQNRRSRSRRRQRQLQAAGANIVVEQRSYQPQLFDVGVVGGGAIQYEHSDVSNFASFPPSFLVGSSSSNGVMSDDGMENLLSRSPQMGFQEQSSSDITSVLCPSEISNLQNQSGFITVFINGVPTEVPKGPLDVKAMFGQDVVLVHSSGVPLPMNEFGFLLDSLVPGETYFLVS